MIFAAGAHGWEDIENNRRIYGEAVGELASLGAAQGVKKFVLVSSGGVTQQRSVWRFVVIACVLALPFTSFDLVLAFASCRRVRHEQDSACHEQDTHTSRTVCVASRTVCVTSRTVSAAINGWWLVAGHGAVTCRAEVILPARCMPRRAVLLQCASTRDRRLHIYHRRRN